MKTLKNDSQQGFTLIELLIVVTIVGLLSGIVLVPVNNARKKGEDAAIKANMHVIPLEAALYSDNNDNNYTDLCDEVGINLSLGIALEASREASDIIYGSKTNHTVSAKPTNAQGFCFSNDTYYVSAIPLSTDKTLAWCLDSDGSAREVKKADFGTYDAMTKCP